MTIRVVTHFRTRTTAGICVGWVVTPYKHTKLTGFAFEKWEKHSSPDECVSLCVCACISFRLWFSSNDIFYYLLFSIQYAQMHRYFYSLFSSWRNSFSSSCKIRFCTIQSHFLHHVHRHRDVSVLILLKHNTSVNHFSSHFYDEIMWFYFSKEIKKKFLSLGFNTWSMWMWSIFIKWSILLANEIENFSFYSFIICLRPF